MNTSPYLPPPARTVQPPVPPIPRASKGRVLRRGLRRSVQGIGAGLRALFAGRPILVACLILLLPLFGWLAYDRLFAPSSSSSGAQIAVQLPEPPVIKQYLAAVQKGDTDGVWNTLSAGQKARRVARNEDKTILARILQAEQQSKMTYTGMHYVGSYQDAGAGAGALYFYVGEIGTGTQKRMLPLMFAVDRNGAIVEVDDGLYEAILAQLKGGP